MVNTHAADIRRPERLGRLALLALALSLAPSAAAAQTIAVNLAWDGTPDTEVAGYVVYVGTAPGTYTERYDAGDLTSFIFKKAESGRPYFFAVAAYTHDGEEGDRSDEIVFLAGTATTMPASAAPATADASATTGPAVIPVSAHGLAQVPGPRCVPAPQSAGCVAADAGIELPGTISALAPTGDGRLLFIHDRRHVRLTAAGVLMPDAALSADAGTELSGLVLDPAFQDNRFVYVGEERTRGDGTRVLTIVRYRELAGVLAEGAAVVVDLPLAGSGHAPFAIDGTGRIYVAMPAVGPTVSPFDGMVLRFEHDGTVPRGSRAGSPIYARGDRRPLALVWSDSANELWLAGSPDSGGLVRLPVGDGVEWPLASRHADGHDAKAFVALSNGIGGASHLAGQLLAVEADGAVLRIDARARRTTPLLTSEDLGSRPLLAAADRDDLYVVVSAGPDAPARLVRLRLQR